MVGIVVPGARPGKRTEERMDHQEPQSGAGTSGVPREFIALTHGQEWVEFYESFDKLVQDHLQRSSELLRRALALPEVADREVAQVRAEMEAKLAAEREQSRKLLGQLREELAASQRQVSALSESVQSLIADLDRLNARLGESLQSYDEEKGAAEAAPAQAENPVVAGATDSFVASATATAEAGEATPEQTTGEAPVAVTAEASSEEPAADEVAAQPEEPASAPVDLAAIAASEAAEPASETTEPAPDEARKGTNYLNGDNSTVDRPRPHWLSVTRIGTR